MDFKNLKLLHMELGLRINNNLFSQRTLQAADQMILFAVQKFGYLRIGPDGDPLPQNVS